MIQALLDGRLAMRRAAAWARFNPAPLWISAIGILALAAAVSFVLQVRTTKYLVSVIVAGVCAVLFLAVRERHALLLTAAGFVLPFYISLNLLMRDGESICLTGVSIIVLVLGAVVFAMPAGSRPKPYLAPAVTVPAVLYLAAGALSFINTTDRTLTTIAVIRTAEMTILFLILVNSIWEEKHLHAFLRGFYAAFAVECVIYVIQNIIGFSFDIVGNTKWVGATDLDTGHIGSQRGTFSAAPAVAALYFSLVSLSLIGLYLCRRRLPVRLPPVAGIVMGVGCLALAAKRAPLAGFVLGLGVMWLLLARYARDGMRRMARVLVALAVPVAAFAPVLLLRSRANIFGAYDVRMNLTRVAWRMWETHPIVGVGMGTYDTVKRAFLPEDWRGWLHVVHNNYLMVLAETGALGLFLLVVLYLMVLVMAYRGIRRIAPAYRPLQIAMVCGLVAVYWEMYWDIFGGRPQLYIVWYFVALAIILPRVLKPDPAEAPA